MSLEIIKTKKIAIAAFAIYKGGTFLRYEMGEFIVTSPWSISETTSLFMKSDERRFDRHIIRLRDLKRIG